MEWQHLPVPLLSSILSSSLSIVWSLHSYIHSCGQSLHFSCSAAEGVTERCTLRVTNTSDYTDIPNLKMSHLLILVKPEIILKETLYNIFCDNKNIIAMSKDWYVKCLVLSSTNLICCFFEDEK